MLLETLASVVMSLEASDSVNILRESPCVCVTLQNDLIRSLIWPHHLKQYNCIPQIKVFFNIS